MMDISTRKSLFKNNFNHFYSLIGYFIRLFLVTMCVFLFFRFAFLILYGNKADLAGNLSDLCLAFLAGFRFDTTVTTYGMMPSFLLILSVLVVSGKYKGYPALVRKLVFYYSMFLIFAFLCLCLVDFYFYKFFQFHINILFFGIVNDDTLSVLKSVWTDYPLIGIFLFIAACMFLFRYVFKKMSKKEYHNPIKNPMVKTAVVLVLMAGYLIGLRGSLGTFPIENEDSIVSENTFINTLTMNGVFALKNAISEKNNQKIDTDIQKTLARHGFATGEEAVSAYLGVQADHTKEIEQQLIAYTRRDSFIRQNPPNVIFIQMESFGNYYLDFHSPTLNLLGRLEGQLKDCILFRNFLSGTTGTIHTLEGLMLGSPLTPISQSTFLDCSLSSSVAMPYLKAGYHTSFVTSADLGWRNLDKFVPLQYFESVEGSESLARKVAGASRGQWGIFDEYLFDRMLAILNESNGKPQFMFALTTTNHTPFELPSTYTPYPVAIPGNIRKVLRTSERMAQKNFTNYQYANDCLGRFIEQVRNSPFGENTIIAATGDHSSLQLFNFEDNKTLQKFSVPFLLYVPEKYLPDHQIDTTRFGSHRDIFPTLFNLSLSEAAYLRSGVDLTDSRVGNNFSILNYNLAMDDNGCVEFQFEPLYYKWTSANSKLLEPTTLQQTPELAGLLKRARAYNAAMSMYIQMDLQKCKN
jgi:phosphoglycerol transferase MdoB-like AlkP superfamily enzyme